MLDWPEEPFNRIARPCKLLQTRTFQRRFLNGTTRDKEDPGLVKKDFIRFTSQVHHSENIIDAASMRLTVSSSGGSPHRSRSKCASIHGNEIIP